MKRLIIGTAGLLFTLVPASAQYPGKGIAPAHTPLSEVERVALPPMDNEALLEAELQSREPGRPPRFASPAEVDITPRDYGNWEELADGTAVWRLRITSPGAHSLNFGFLEYYMPPAGRFLIYDPAQSRVAGPFTASDNEAHQQLWTPILEGDEAVLEVQLPASRRKDLRLRLTTVNHDFLGFMEVLSGACNLDVLCGEADNWAIVNRYREAIQSVAVYGTGGTTFCSGFLINNTRNDCTPYFMTAHHCGINPASAPSVVVYWNYQNSYCRQPGTVASGSPGDGQLNNFNTGAIYRAGYTATDFTLLELDDPLLNSTRAFFAGWSRDAAPPEDTLACVHHPDGAEKRISFSFSDAYAGAWGSGSAPVAGGNHLIVPSWNVGATESGSSGAPLLNRQGRAVGQLRGGAASCGNSQYDAFGWFRYSWTGGGTPNTRLKDWLDPNDTNLLFLDGHWLSGCNAGIAVTGIQEEACIPGAAQYQVVVSEGFFGPATLSVHGLPGGVSATFSPNPAAPGAVATLSLSAYNASIPSGAYVFIIRAQDGYSSVQATATIRLFSQSPAPSALIAPASGSYGQPLAPAFQWEAHPLALSYDLQVAKDYNFYDVIGSSYGLVHPQCQSVILEPASTYYYRVRGRNTCGPGPWSAPSEFRTAGVLCGPMPSTAPPAAIPPQGGSSVTLPIEVAGPGTVAGVVVRNIFIDHTYVGDLSACLRSPSGTVVELFHRPGFPNEFYGCSGANLEVGFADDAPNSQQALEATCNTYPPAISGMFRPISPLSALIGEPAAGAWELTVSDHFDQDGGQFKSWELNLCTTFPNVAQLFPLRNEAAACLGNPYAMDIYVGSGFSGPVSLYLIGAPAGSVFHFSDNASLPGSFVTLTIDSIAQPGNYTLIVAGADGSANHFFHQELAVGAPPASPQLIAPENESPVFTEHPVFTWSPVAGADTFVLQIAADTAFQSIVQTARVATPYFTLDSPMPGAIYYWRVFAANACGASPASDTFTFSFQGSTTESREHAAGQGWQLFPNPTGGRLHIRWEGIPDEALSGVEIFTAEGQLALSREFADAVELSLEGLPAGLYLVLLRNSRGVAARRVVVY